MVTDSIFAVAPQYVALIPAAGVGTRMGAATPKQYMVLGNKTILQHTVDAFLNFAPVQHTYVVVSPDDGYVDSCLQNSDRLTVLRCGGASRRDSVRNGLRLLANRLASQDWVLVHDAARPGLNNLLLQRLLDEVGSHPVGGLLALPVVDTVKRVHNGRVETVPRDGLWLAQTPQIFRYQLLCDALDAAQEVTDEASAVEAAGYVPLLVEGHACNLKLTLPGDVALAEKYLSIGKE
ncbi:2-C-methyl-D-erythritol 4-phosphate cytidylyltransferase [Undibacterium sp. TJN19]|uniref:2-C-methyl-D-erythritol 4-phosphate cytidylyltransferase n=1 Tax=Undibacterium sp. TJN19 TaxID=3413055 RepID=UPI003BF22274